MVCYTAIADWYRCSEGKKKLRWRSTRRNILRQDGMENSGMELILRLRPEGWEEAPHMITREEYEETKFLRLEITCVLAEDLGGWSRVIPGKGANEARGRYRALQASIKCLNFILSTVGRFEKVLRRRGREKKKKKRGREKRKEGRRWEERRESCFYGFNCPSLSLCKQKQECQLGDCWRYPGEIMAEPGPGGDIGSTEKWVG